MGVFFKENTLFNFIMRILFSLMSNFEVFVASFCPIGGLWLLFFNIRLSASGKAPKRYAAARWRFVSPRGEFVVILQSKQYGPYGFDSFI